MLNMSLKIPLLFIIIIKQHVLNYLNILLLHFISTSAIPMRLYTNIFNILTIILN